tara:strand:- start:625 stop:909 length:285 start_codon:yes stop_codon:yes gene_type:complete
LGSASFNPQINLISNASLIVIGPGGEVENECLWRRSLVVLHGGDDKPSHAGGVKALEIFAVVVLLIPHFRPSREWQKGLNYPPFARGRWFADHK